MPSSLLYKLIGIVIAILLLFSLPKKIEFYIITTMLAPISQRVKTLIPTLLNNIIILGLRSMVIR